MADFADSLSILDNALNRGASGGAVPMPSGETPSAPIVTPRGEPNYFINSQGQKIAQASADPVADSLSILDGALKNAPTGETHAAAQEEPKATVPSIIGNFGVGANDRIAAIAGAPVDLVTGAINKGYGLLSGSNSPLIQDPFMGSGTFKRALGVIGANPDRQPAPQNAWERNARLAGGAATDALAMTMGARALSPVLPSGPTAVASNVVRSIGEAPLPTTAVAAGTGAVAGNAAENAIPDEYSYLRPLANFGANIGAGLTTAGIMQGGKAALQAGWNAARDWFRPFTAGGREALAGQQLAGSATNPGAVRATLNDLENGGELVEGSQPTTGQVTGDPGLLRLERAAATRDQSEFMARRAAQNQSRVSALESLAPEGSSSGAAADRVRQLADDTETQVNQIYSDALQRAQQRNLALGGNLSADQYGSIMRDNLASAKTAAKTVENRLWQKLDPTGTKAIDVAPTIDAAKSIADSVPKLGRPMGGEEAAIFDAASNLPQVAPFKEVSALYSRIGDAVRAEQLPGGDSQALRRLVQLRTALVNNFASAGNAAETAGPESADSAVASGSAPSVGARAFTPSGRGVDVRYEVVEGSDLVPSHVNGRENPNFPGELQPRDRTRVASDAQIARISSNLQPERLGPSNDVGTGAPVVGPDNVVESGNARVGGIMGAYARGGPQAQAYRDYLTQQGYDLEGIKNPVLVRRRLSDLAPADRVAFTQESNAAPGLAMSATEQATLDAQRLPASLFNLYRGGDLASPENRPFLREFVRSVAMPGEEGALATPEARPSADLLRRAQNAMTARAYPDSGLVSALAETGDENIRAFGNGLRNVAPEVAQLRDAIASGRVPREFDISAPAMEAASLVQRARAARVPLADFVAQRDALNEITPAAEGLLRGAFGDDLRGRMNQYRFNDLMRFYVDEAGKQSTEPALFASEVTPQQILATGVSRYGKIAPPAESAAPISPENAGGVGPGNGTGGNQTSGLGPAAARPGAPGQASAGGNGILPQEPLAPNYTAEDAQAYRAARAATREGKQTFGVAPIRDVLREQPGGGGYTLSDAKAAAKIVNNSLHGFNDATAYLKAVGNRPEAVQAFKDAVILQMRDKAMRADGTLDPAKVQAWLDNAAYMRLFPEFGEKITDAASADRAVQLAAQGVQDAMATFQNGVASKFLNGGDPVSAVSSALKSRDPVGSMGELARMVSPDPTARAGLQRAVVELMQRDLLSNEIAGETQVLKPGATQNFIRENAPALSQIFSPDQIGLMDRVAADVQRAQQSVTSKLPGTPGTAQDLMAAGHGGSKSILARVVIGEALGAIGELATAHEATLGVHSIIGPAVAVVVGAMRDAGLEKVNDLVGQAMLHPELARSLLARVPETDAVPMAKIIASQLRNITALATERGAESFARTQASRNRAAAR